MFKKIKFCFTDKPQLSIEDFNLELRENGDFWRLHLDYMESGKNRELGVYSHHQKTPEIANNDGETILTYPKIIAEDGSMHNIRLVLKIKEDGDALRFCADMENNSSVRINELQFPLFETTKIHESMENDELILPEGVGKKIKSPNAYVQDYHTEYMAADYKNIWMTMQYPTPLTMPWIGIQSGNKYLYIGNHSEKFRMCSFCTGTQPRNSEDKYTVYTISSYPAVMPGENVCYDGFVVKGFEGDWRDGVDFYRSWADSTWNKNEKPKKTGIDTVHGWQRIILKHQYGEIFHTYKDLPKLYKEGLKYGLTMILLFAWWEEGMDNGYPNYRPDPALGGADELKKAIKEINDMGGIVILYANGHIIDISTEYYKNEGHKYTQKNIEKIEYREFYTFSNNGTLLRHGNKTFAGCCHGVKSWRDKLLEIEERHLSLNSNGTFFDQIACCFRLCFDETHEHKGRIDEEPEYRLLTMKQMNEKLLDNQYLGTEWLADRLTCQVDFTHGCGFAHFYSENVYPYIFRYAFPYTPFSNRLLHDERKDWKRQLNYTFTFGLLFDVSIYRGRADSIEVVPDYAKYTKHLIDIRNKYCDVFARGKVDLPGISLPEGIKSARISYGNKSILTLWNDSENEITVLGKTLKPQEVDVIEVQ